MRVEIFKHGCLQQNAFIVTGAELHAGVLVSKFINKLYILRHAGQLKKLPICDAAIELQESSSSPLEVYRTLPIPFLLTCVEEKTRAEF